MHITRASFTNDHVPSIHIWGNYFTNLYRGMSKPAIRLRASVRVFSNMSWYFLSVAPLTSRTPRHVLTRDRLRLPLWSAWSLNVALHLHIYFQINFYYRSLNSTSSIFTAKTSSHRILLICNYTMSARHTCRTRGWHETLRESLVVHEMPKMLVLLL
jgi:hypothetical protein